MRLIIWIISATVIVIATVFAVANRGPVEISFWPLPYTLTPPLFAILILAVLAGFLFGAVTTWWSGRHVRKRARERAIEIEGLQRDVDALKARVKEAQAAKPVETGTSALPVVTRSDQDDGPPAGQTVPARPAAAED